MPRQGPWPAGTCATLKEIVIILFVAGQRPRHGVNEVQLIDYVCFLEEHRPRQKVEVRYV